ncbi:hypothetical protein KP509_36G013700 [Ceratopteris richardii]|uniref:Uncharacterized protein n=1 Tax=Ceratopteris richardii TaxID=49495 RepID=A0A8T2QAV2_CERRI|nr:hypothetical protein KP509_36G013700 [Ceratopteris richardii]
MPGNLQRRADNEGTFYLAKQPLIHPEGSPTAEMHLFKHGTTSVGDYFEHADKRTTSNVEKRLLTSEVDTRDLKRLKPSGYSTHSPLVTCKANDPLHLRWNTLRQLLPQNPQVPVNEDDLLFLVFEYVRSLEAQIKAFKNEEHAIDLCDGSIDKETGILKRKGLCIVPLSQFTRTF